MIDTTEESSLFDFAGARARLMSRADWTRNETELSKVFKQRAAQLARRPDEADARAGTSHVRFSAHEVTFAVELARVRTIVVPSSVTVIPCVPAHLSRVVQVNGRIVSLVDLGALLGLPAKHTDQTTAILLEAGSLTLGIMAHRVLGIVPIDAGELSPSASSASQGTHFISGITPDMTLVLDAPRMLEELVFESTQRST